MADQVLLWEELEPLLFQVGEERRWIQDSPVLPNVWRAFAVRPGLPIDLLITPHLGTRPSHLANAIREAVAPDDVSQGAESATEAVDENDPDESEAIPPAPVEAPVGPVDAGHEIAFNQSTVVARIHFDELIQSVVPKSRWFERNIAGSLDKLHKLSTGKGKLNKSRLEMALRDVTKDDQRPETLSPLVAWWLRLTGYFSLRLENPQNGELTPEAIWDRALHLLPRPSPRGAVPANGSAPRLFRIALNRRASTASVDAVRVVKADAANTVFGIDTSRIC
jgi:hypothetical protein